MILKEVKIKKIFNEYFPLSQLLIYSLLPARIYGQNTYN